jgi:LacI family transcriptional regulator
MENREKQHIRIKDIAEKAGCSIGTVDRVIHNRGKVSKAVRERILAIIEELNYRPNVNARVLASKRPLTLGILLPAYRAGEYWELPNLGIREAVGRYRNQGYDIRPVHYGFNTPEAFFQAGMKLLSDEIDGIILSPASYKETVRLVRHYFQHKKPFILIDSDIQGIPSLSFIGKDPVQSGVTVAKLIHQITRHMSGQKLIWTINLTDNLNQMYALLARESGFMNYYAEKSLLEEYRFLAYDMEDRGGQKPVDQQMEEMITEGRPDAIYVTGSRVHKIARSLKKIRMAEKPILIGHDLIQANIERVRDESIDFLIEEEARRQGYLAVESMIRSVVHKERIDRKQFMNLMIYTMENLPSDPSEQGSGSLVQEKGNGRMDF